MPTSRDLAAPKKKKQNGNFFCYGFLTNASHVRQRGNDGSCSSGNNAERNRIGSSPPCLSLIKENSLNKKR